MEQASVGKRNLLIIWFTNFLIAGSITMVLPFISLYIETFGDFSDRYVKNWSGLIFGVTFVTAFIFSPIWGRIGDKYGRKKIMFLSAAGMGLSILLMGFAHSVWHLFFLRMFMGVFTGFIPMSQAFISTQTPKNIAGSCPWDTSDWKYNRTFVGPALGGIFADYAGFSTTFIGTSFAIFLSALLVLATKEYRLQDKKGTKSSYSSKEVIMHLLSHPILLNVLLISTLIQIAHFSIQPILSLYVSEVHGPDNLAFISGLTFSAAGLGNLMMAKQWGKIADRFGYIKILIILLFGAAIVYLPGGFVTNVWQLILVRFLLGVTIGGIVPVRIAYIRQEAPIAMQGEVLGYNTSLRFLGNVIGPLLGGFVSAYFGFTAVFITTSALLFISGVILLSALHRHQEEPKHSI